MGALCENLFSGTEWKTIMEWIIIFAVVVVVLSILGAYGQNEYEKMEQQFFKGFKDEAEKNIEILFNNNPDFKADFKYISYDKKAFIAVEENSRRILIGGRSLFTGKLDYKIIRASEMLGVELTENGIGLLSSSKNINTLGMAALGGVLFGGAGAVVGAISGSDTKSRITEVGLRIALDNIKTPYIAINFATEVVGKGSNTHMRYLKTAERWYGIVNILIEREKRKDSP